MFASSDALAPSYMASFDEQIYKYPKEYKGRNLDDYGKNEYEGVAATSLILDKPIAIKDVNNKILLEKEHPYFKQHVRDIVDKQNRSGKL